MTNYFLDEEKRKREDYIELAFWITQGILALCILIVIISSLW